MFFSDIDRCRMELRRFRHITNLLDKMVVVNPEDRPFPFLLTLTPSCSRSYDDLRLMRSIPYFHYLTNGSPETEGIANSETAELLFTFRGDLGTHPVRRVIAEFGNSCEWEVTPTSTRWPDSSIDRAAFKRDYQQSLLRGRFVLCPRGRGPASMRLFEVMRAGRAPVIIADDWLPPAGVDWERFSVFVAERDVSHLPDILRSRADEAEAMGRLARTAWEQRFSERTVFDTLVAEAATLLRLGSSPGVVRLAIQAMRRLFAGELSKGDAWHYWAKPMLEKFIIQ